MLEKSQDSRNIFKSSIISFLRDHYIVLLIFITAVGFFLRFFGLNGAPLTPNEIAIASLSRHPISHIQRTIENGSVPHPPFYYWTQHLFFMFGITEFSIRFLSVLCGTISIPAVYLLGKEFYSKDTGILAAAIIATSSLHILSSQAGTPQSMMLLFLLVSLIFFIRIIKADSSVSGALFGFFSGLAFWVMYYSILLTLPLYIFELVERKKGFRQRFGENRALYTGLIFFLFVIVSLPGLLHNLEQIPGFMSYHGFFMGGNMILEGFNQSYYLNKSLMIVTIILLVIGIGGLFHNDNQLFSLLFFIIFIPIALGIIISCWIPLDPMYLLIVLPGVCLGAGFSYTIIYSFLSRWIMVSRLKILVIFLLFFLALSLPYGSMSHNLII